jgi:hypothetical protein
MIIVSREGERRERRQGDRRPGIQRRDQLPQRRCTSGEAVRIGRNPHSLENQTRENSARPLAVECSNYCPGHGMADPEAAASVTQKPASAARHPVQLTCADPGRHGPGSCNEGVPILRSRARVEDAEEVVAENDVPDTQRTEPSRDLISKGGGFFTGHRDQRRRRSI